MPAESEGRPVGCGAFHSVGSIAQGEAAASTLPWGASDAEKEMSVVAEKEMIENTLPPPTQQDFLPRDASLTASPAAQKKGVKRGKKPIISDSLVRRSSCIHALNEGFKPSVCKDRNCLGCSTKHPLILRELGASFCKMNSSELTDEKLHAKPSSRRPVGQPKKPRTSSTDSEQGEDLEDGGSSKNKD